MNKKLITISAVAIAAALLFTVNGGNVSITQSGTPDSHLVIDLQNIQYKSVSISGSYVDVSNINVKGSQSHGILITGKYVTVDGFTVDEGVNENRTSTGCGNAQWGSGVKVAIGGENIIIKNGRISRNCGEGVAITRGKNVLVDNVIVEDNFSVNFYIDNSVNVTVQNSTALCSSPTYYRSGEPANSFLLGEENYSGWGAQLSNITIQNNYATGCKGIRLYEQFSSGGLKSATITGNTLAQVWKNATPILIATYPQNRDIVISGNVFPPYVYATFTPSVVSPTVTRTPTRIPIKTPECFIRRNGETICIY